MAMPEMFLQSVAFAVAPEGRWHLGIGDPTVIGWLITGAYFVSAYLAHTTRRACQDAARRLNASDPLEAEDHRLLARLWMLVMTVMLLLGINKQLDLHSLFGEVLRDLIRHEAWYKDRHHYQVLFTGATVLLGAFTVLIMLYWQRSVMRRALGAVVGLGVVGVFVIIRAASFNHVELLWSGESILNSVLELGGICIVGVSAVLARRADLPS